MVTASCTDIVPFNPIEYERDNRGTESTRGIFEYLLLMPKDDGYREMMDFLLNRPFVGSGHWRVIANSKRSGLTAPCERALFDLVVACELKHSCEG
jgi:hypothetical protein